MKIRIDDYPTGVKPVIDNRFERFSKILSLFEDREIEYHLGVVPMMITEEDIQFLKELKYCRPCIHGYDHNFQKWRFKEDRDEFKLETVEQIEYKLQWGLDRLSELDVELIYIPTFNRMNQNLIDALYNLNFLGITTGVTPPKLDFKNLKVYTPKFNFYGRSGDIYHRLDGFTKKDHLALHLTWEVEEYDKDWKLPEIISLLQHKL